MYNLSIRSPPSSGPSWSINGSSMESTKSIMNCHIQKQQQNSAKQHNSSIKRKKKTTMSSLTTLNKNVHSNDNELLLIVVHTNQIYEQKHSTDHTTLSINNDKISKMLSICKWKNKFSTIWSIWPTETSSSTSTMASTNNSSRFMKNYYFLILILLLFTTTFCQHLNKIKTYSSHGNSHRITHQSSMMPSFSSSLSSMPTYLLPNSDMFSSSSSSSSSLSSSSLPAITKDAPEFISEMSNQTIALGRDVVFECIVNHLGSYKLAWLKIDSLDDGTKSYTNEPELISIQTQIMSKDPTSRYRVANTNQKQWFLHIKQVKSSDKGWYMCQINTEPLISQAAFLDILIAPSIDYNATSSDVSVDERHRLSIRCRAIGHPPPTVIWRREDNKDINLGQYGGKRYSAKKVEGEFLNITQVTRDDMGAYLCIASNSVPPSVSKRIIVHVNFRPKIKVSNQLVGSTVGSDVQLECRCEASPRPIASWIRYDGQILTTSTKYHVKEEHDSYRTKMKLRIFNMEEKDFGSYKCVAKNVLGEKEGLVRLYEIAPPSTPYLLSSWPTYIYTYQGRQNNQNIQNYHQSNMTNLMDKNYDYNDYNQQASSSSSKSTLLLFENHVDCWQCKTIIITMSISMIMASFVL